MKKRLLVMLTLVLFLFCLAACGNETQPTENNPTSGQTETESTDETPTAETSETVLTAENVKSVMADILPGAADVYRNILYGGYSAGEYNDTDVKVANDSSYAPVADSNFDTMAKLKAEAEKYYTASYAENNLYQTLNGNFPIYKEFDGKLYVNIDGGGNGGYTFLADTATLTSAENGIFVVSVECIDNYETKYTATLSLVADGSELKINAAEYE